MHDTNDATKPALSIQVGRMVCQNSLDWNNARGADIKREYAAMGRTYCEHCGNSDVEMHADDICVDCQYPEYAAARNRLDAQDNLYVYGDMEP